MKIIKNKPIKLINKKFVIEKSKLKNLIGINTNTWNCSNGEYIKYHKIINI